MFVIFIFILLIIILINSINANLVLRFSYIICYNEDPAGSRHTTREIRFVTFTSNIIHYGLYSSARERLSSCSRHGVHDAYPPDAVGKG